MRKLYLLLLAISTVTAAPVALRAAVREDTRLDSGWRFAQSDVPNAGQSNFDDSGWPMVSIPHNWGWDNAQRGKDFYHGIGWYRRELNVGEPAAGKRYFLRFEAASQVADVYVNGKRLGQHRGAFGAFCFEITKVLSASGSNVLAVCVSNAKEPDIAPVSGDFSVYGGLYRPVHLIVTGAENFTLTDHGSPGVAWLQTSVSSKRAVLDMTAQISNGTTDKQPLTLVASVFDATGNCVVSNAESITLGPRDTTPYFLRLTVPEPHLWNGRKDPYLYKAVLELRSAHEVVDLVEQPLGLRFFSVDPDKGFFLNGQPYPVQGVNRHQDMMGKGWAISEADMDADLTIIKELGATAIRCCHYQHSDYFYSLCDRAGILVWAEIPQVDKVSDSTEFSETSRSQLLDLIRQSVNHPSIFCWSLFNELRPKNPDSHRLLQDLKVTANGEDPTRPTIAATCAPALPQMNKIPDLLGWNVYYGWYADWGPLSEFDPMRATYRYTSRHGGYCISEYGAGANVEQHEQNPLKPKNDGQWHPEEYQSIVHEKAWAELKAAPYIWGTFVWCMFDFAVSTRHEGGQPGLNDKGLVTRDRKTKKDAFYFYKANWSDEPVLYIASRRFTERTNAVTDIKLYSNAPEAELFINRVSQGKNNDSTNGVFIWKNVTLKSGENRIEARAVRSGQMMTDNCTWTLK